MKKRLTEIKIFLKGLFNKLIEDDIFALSAQLAYPMIMSLIPLVMFIILLAGNMEIPYSDIYNLMRFALPAPAYTIVERLINEITASASLSLAVFIPAVLFISMGVRALMKSLNKAYVEVEHRSVIKLYLLSFAFGVILAFLIVFCLGFLILGTTILNAAFALLRIRVEIPLIVHIFKYLLAYILLGLIFCIIYRYAPNLKLKPSQIYKGGYFAAFCLIIVSVLFGYYIENFSSYGIVFGSLGGLFVLFTWVYMLSFIILLGGEINSLLYEKEKDKSPGLK